ncbi:aromatic acid exporter family protein [Streptomyces sp. NPDC098781]|uniref:FUSC family protein n=1 Tax=Streptomyces sp. NPDC098781 TaxID=3366097 RepID=UPI0038064ECB
MTDHLSGRTGQGRVAGVLSLAGQRMSSGMWPVLHQTAAAVVAWVIAGHLIDHHQPVFAPIAALVGLNASRGERGSNAVRLFVGVILGIVTAEAATAVLPHRSSATLALSVFAAMMIALAVHSERTVTAQAGVSAVIAVATSQPHVGPDRIVDAAIGVGVSLLFSQLLLPAEPVALLRRAEAAALSEMAEALALGAGALRAGDRALADRAVAELQDVGDELADLRNVRVSSGRSARRSPIWWTRVASVRRESEAAGRLVLVGSGCLVLTRTAMAAPARGHTMLASVLQRLSETLTELAGELADNEARMRSGTELLTLVGELAHSSGTEAVAANAVRPIVLGVAVDVLVFCGADERDALEAVLAAPRPREP